MSAALPRAAWALMFGNVVVGCGVMAATASLNDLASSLQVSVPVAGQLTSSAALVMMLGAPLLAAWVAGFDRRRLLTAALLWFAAGHALCAAMPGYGSLLFARAATVLAAAAYTPQAAAAIGVMLSPGQRGQAITFVFMGWSVASVLGMPLNAAVSEAWGWRSAFASIAVLALAASLGVWRAMPDGVKPAALSRSQWAGVFKSRLLMATVAVTALSSAGQFVLFAYMAAYYHQVLGATGMQVSLLFLCFGAFGVLGNVWVSRHIDAMGPARMVAITLSGMLVSLLLWPFAQSVWSMLLVQVPWALACFSGNSAQQARLGHAAPSLTPALMAMNSSALYLGQFLGAGLGGLVIAAQGMRGLSHWALAWMAMALLLSLWAAQAARAAKAS